MGWGQYSSSDLSVNPRESAPLPQPGALTVRAMNLSHPVELEERLTAYLGRRMGARPTITALRPMTGGASREIWAFDLEAEGSGIQSLVLRMDPKSDYLEGKRSNEFEVMRLAFDAGVAVPEPLWLEEDPGVLGGGFFIMRRVEGETLAKRLHRDPKYAAARERIVAQFGEALAIIHGIEVTPQLTASGGLKRLTPAAAIDDQDAIYRRVAVDPHPVIEYAIRWLRENAPPPGKMTLVHGDFRLGNVIFGEEGLRAVLDWELAQIGDPVEDLAWPTVRSWRFGRDQWPVAGLGTRERLHEAYEKAGGDPVDPQRAFFWEVYGNLKWAIITVSQVGSFLKGAPSVELAALGRRTVEMEWELLNLLDSPRS